MDFTGGDWEKDARLSWWWTTASVTIMVASINISSPNRVLDKSETHLLGNSPRATNEALDLPQERTV